MQPSCQSGGRHRKGHKSRKTRASRKMKGGMGYGFGGVIGTGGAEWVPSNTSAGYLPTGELDTKTNDLYSGDKAAMVGGRRYRKSKKATRKSRKGKKKSRRTRKMKGGANVFGVNGGVVNAGAVGYGYSGPQAGVVGGIAPAAGYAAKVGGAEINADGTHSA